jgi:hypothetical protein
MTPPRQPAARAVLRYSAVMLAHARNPAVRRDLTPGGSAGVFAKDGLVFGAPTGY